MKSKMSLIIAFLILVLPLVCYSLFKVQTGISASAQTFGKPEVVEFYTPLCSECQKLQKVMDVVEPKYSKYVVFTKIDASLPSETEMEQIKKYHVRVVPTTVFIDKKGNVNARVEGSMSEATLSAKLKELSE